MALLKNEIKILIVVEGEKTEPDFFGCYMNKFGINAEVFIVKNNLYSLYYKMKKYNFYCDVKDVLIELNPSNREILNNKFTYTYLIFDSDLQHHGKNFDSQQTSIVDLSEENFKKLKEMAAYFTNETDPSIGRLYINYPMMESYRYCDDFCDEDYINAVVSVEKMKEFKRISSSKKLARISVKKYSKDNFSDLIGLNVRKLHYMTYPTQLSFPTYDIFLEISSCIGIANLQFTKMKNDNLLSVLNTSLFLVLNYFGNRDKFYDKLFENKLV